MNILGIRKWKKRMWVQVLGAFLIVLQGVGCETPQFLTVMVYEDPHRQVRLQTFPGVNDGKGFAHPAYLQVEDVKKILSGIYVEIDNATLSLPFTGSSSFSAPRRAFSDMEVDFFAPLIVEGLGQATPEEVVTFFETAEISDTQEITTSGGVYLEDDIFYVLLSNYSTKRQIWQDNEHYEAPYRLRPLEPIEPQPGRLVFEPSNLMVEVKEGFLQKAFKAEPWQVGVRYKELK